MLKMRCSKLLQIYKNCFLVCPNLYFWYAQTGFLVCPNRPKPMFKNVISWVWNWTAVFFSMGCNTKLCAFLCLESCNVYVILRVNISLSDKKCCHVLHKMLSCPTIKTNWKMCTCTCPHMNPYVVGWRIKEKYILFATTRFTKFIFSSLTC